MPAGSGRCSRSSTGAGLPDRSQWSAGEFVIARSPVGVSNGGASSLKALQRVLDGLFQSEGGSPGEGGCKGFLAQSRPHRRHLAIVLRPLVGQQRDADGGR
jgi:hypothetical protein